MRALELLASITRVRLFSTLQGHPRLVAIVGALSGWASVDWLKATQFLAAGLASLVSLCALILTGPQAIEKLRKWLNKLLKTARS